MDVSFDGHTYHYVVNSTVLIEMDIDSKGINLAGFLKKSVILYLFRNNKKNNFQIIFPKINYLKII